MVFHIEFKNKFDLHGVKERDYDLLHANYLFLILHGNIILTHIVLKKKKKSVSTKIIFPDNYERIKYSFYIRLYYIQLFMVVSLNTFTNLLAYLAIQFFFKRN